MRPVKPDMAQASALYPLCRQAQHCSAYNVCMCADASHTDCALHLQSILLLKVYVVPSRRRHINSMMTITQGWPERCKHEQLC